VSEGIEDTILTGVVDSIKSGAQQLSSITGEKSSPINAQFLKKFNIDNIIGNVFEGILGNLGGKFSQKQTAGQTFDFPNGLKDSAKAFTNSALLAGTVTEAKSTATKSNFEDIVKKVKTFIGESVGSISLGDPAKFTTGAVKASSGKVLSGGAAKGRNVRSAGLVGKPTKFNKDSAARLLKKSDGEILGLTDGQIGQAGSYRKFLGVRQDSLEARKEFLQSVLNAKNKGGRIRLNSGGMVPVALTPGELVFDPTAAEKAGLSQLQRFNKTGDVSQIPQLNSGGSVSMVPGTGNTDSFFTQLKEGSFVVKKSSSQKALGLNRGGSVGRVRLNQGSDDFLDIDDVGNVDFSKVQSPNLPNTTSNQPSKADIQFEEVTSQIKDLTFAIDDLGEAAIEAERATGKSIQKESQLSNESKRKLKEARAPLVERRESLKGEASALDQAPERIQARIDAIIQKSDDLEQAAIEAAESVGVSRSDIVSPVTGKLQRKKLPADIKADFNVERKALRTQLETEKANLAAAGGAPEPDIPTFIGRPTAAEVQPGSFAAQEARRKKAEQENSITRFLPEAGTDSLVNSVDSLLDEEGFRPAIIPPSPEIPPTPPSTVKRSISGLVGIDDNIDQALTPGNISQFRTSEIRPVNRELTDSGLGLGDEASFPVPKPLSSLPVIQPEDDPRGVRLTPAPPPPTSLLGDSLSSLSDDLDLALNPDKFENIISEALGSATIPSGPALPPDLAQFSDPLSDTLLGNVGGKFNEVFSGSAFSLGGSDGESSNIGFGEAAKKDASVRATLEQVQKQEAEAIVKELKAKDSSISTIEALNQAREQISEKYGVLAKDIDNDSKTTKLLNSAKEKASETFNKIKKPLQLRTGESQLGRVGRLGKGGIKGGFSLGKRGIGSLFKKATFSGLSKEEKAEKAGQLGDKIQNLGIASLAATPFIQSAIGDESAELAGAGAAVGGAFAGASAGASLGAFAGPLGAAVGGVVGAISGGASSFLTAFDEAADRIRRSEVDKALEEFGEKVKKLGEGGAFDLEGLNSSLAGLAKQALQNQELEAKNNGFLAEQGGIFNTLSDAGANLAQTLGKDIAAAFEGLDIPVPDFVKNFELPSLQDVESFAIDAASSIGTFAESLEDGTSFLGGFGKIIAGVTPGIKLASAASRAQRSPEAIARREKRQQEFIAKESQSRADRNKPLVEAANKAIEESLRSGETTAGDLSGLDPQAFLLLGSASQEAQEKALKAAINIEDAAEKEATIKRVLANEGRKLALTEARRIQEEINLEKAIQNSAKAVSLAVNRFDALSRSAGVASRSGNSFRSEIDLLQGNISNIDLPKLSGSIDLISNADFRGVKESLFNFFGDSAQTREVTGGLDQARLLSIATPNIAAEVASQAGISGESPEVVLRRVLEQRGISATSDIGQNIIGTVTQQLKLSGSRQGFNDIVKIVEEGITGVTNRYSEAVLKAADTLSKAQSDAINEFSKNSKLYSDTIKQAADKIQGLSDLRINRADKLRELQGEELGVGDSFRNLIRRVTVRTRRGGAGNIARPDDIVREIQDLKTQNAQLNKERQGAAARGDLKTVTANTEAINKNIRQQQSLEGALDLLANDVTALAKVESELASLQKQKDEGRGLLQQVAEAQFDPQKARELNKQIFAANA
ncbi:hypothetical protein DRO61_03540, partial [Candidatus Bathyarchaeota archaeon]